MVNIAILMISLLLFSFAARQLGREILSKKHLFPFRTGYSYSALKIERGYKFLTYGIMLGVSFYSLVISFIGVLTGDPF